MIQSYLVIGTPSATKEKTHELLKSLGIKPQPTSPDQTIITPTKKVISIDQVRDVKKMIYQKPLKDPFKVVIFKEAHNLNKEAQNALLKILEEPPRQAIVILESRDKTHLLATVLSRLTTIWTDEKVTTEGELILKSPQNELLRKIAEINDPTSWLDEQMVLLSRELKRQVLSGQKTQRTQNTLVLCKEAKSMIEANVNPKFVLVNLALNL